MKCGSRSHHVRSIDNMKAMRSELRGLQRIPYPILVNTIRATVRNKICDHVWHIIGAQVLNPIRDALRGDLSQNGAI